MRTVSGILFVVLAAVVGTALSVRVKVDAQEKKVDTRVFEMRTYYAAPGKMDALLARFRDHTAKLFEKHGITNIGYWVPTDPAEAQKKLVYILAYPNPAEAKIRWKAFVDDPVWKAASAASEKDGKLVEKVESVFLNPTDFSPIR